MSVKSDFSHVQLMKFTYKVVFILFFSIDIDAKLTHAMVWRMSCIVRCSAFNVWETEKMKGSRWVKKSQCSIMTYPNVIYSKNRCNFCFFLFVCAMKLAYMGCPQCEHVSAIDSCLKNRIDMRREANIDVRLHKKRTTPIEKSQQDENWVTNDDGRIECTRQASISHTHTHMKWK